MQLHWTLVAALWLAFILILTLKGALLYLSKRDRLHTITALPTTTATISTTHPHPSPTHPPVATTASSSRVLLAQRRAARASVAVPPVPVDALCPVCLDPLAVPDGPLVAAAVCAHWLHAHCMAACLHKLVDPACPVCRTPFFAAPAPAPAPAPARHSEHGLSTAELPVELPFVPPSR